MTDHQITESGEAALETEVGHWLQKNRAADLADQFYKQGFEDLADLSDEVIDKVVTVPGTAARLKRALTAERPKPKLPGEAPAIPSLPAGTPLDLSQPVLTSPDGIAFTLPNQLSVTASDAAVVSPLELKPEDWLIIARNSGLLFGYTMEDFSDGKPPLAQHPVLEWVMPADLDFVVAEHLAAQVSADLCYSEQTASYVSCGFDKEAATASYMFCSASFEREHKEKESSQSYKKNLQMIGRWYYPRATLDLQECTRPSPRFIAALNDALATKTPGQALSHVFGTYGTAVPTKVTLGGQLYFRSTHLAEGELQETEVENTIKAAVSVKIGSATGEASFSTGTATNNTVTSQAIADSSIFANNGGDATLVTSPQLWPASVKPALNWATIGRHGVRSTLDLLDEIAPELKARVLQVAVPPAILPAQDLAIQSATVKKTSTPVFILATRAVDRDEGSGGSVSLVCSTDDDPELNDPDAVGGAAVAHFGAFADMHLRCNSICLPVPAFSYFRTDTQATFAGAGLKARIACLPTRLRFGAWQPAFSTDLIAPSALAVAPADGLLFVSIHAGVDGVGGAVHGEVNDQRLGSAAVHWYSPRNDIQTDSSFCIPVPAGASYKVIQAPYCGTPLVRAWWLPSTNPAWRFQQAVGRGLNTIFTAEADGILNATIAAAKDGERGSLELRAQQSFADEMMQLPLACASVHWSSGADRHFTDASAVLPVQSGLKYRVKYVSTSGEPPARAYWTGIVPAT